MHAAAPSPMFLNAPEQTWRRHHLHDRRYDLRRGARGSNAQPRGDLWRAVCCRGDTSPVGRDMCPQFVEVRAYHFVSGFERFERVLTAPFGQLPRDGPDCRGEFPGVGVRTATRFKQQHACAEPQPRRCKRQPRWVRPWRVPDERGRRQFTDGGDQGRCAESAGQGEAGCGPDRVAASGVEAEQGQRYYPARKDLGRSCASAACRVTGLDTANIWRMVGPRRTRARRCTRRRQKQVGSQQKRVNASAPQATRSCGGDTSPRSLAHRVPTQVSSSGPSNALTTTLLHTTTSPLLRPLRPAPPHAGTGCPHFPSTRHIRFWFNASGQGPPWRRDSSPA